MAKPRRTISQRSELTYDWYEFGINADSREMMLTSRVDDGGDAMGVNAQMAGQFCRALRLLSYLGRGPILIHMSTCGGEWEYGMAIYDAIISCPCVVTILAYSGARSMSGLIFQAADYRVLQPNADFMFHLGTFGGNMNYISAQTEASENKRLTAVMLQILVESCRKGIHFRRWSRERIRRELLAHMEKRGEVFLPARQAVEWGFADAVLGDEGYETIDALLE